MYATSLSLDFMTSAIAALMKETPAKETTGRRSPRESRADSVQARPRCDVPFRNARSAVPAGKACDVGDLRADAAVLRSRGFHPAVRGEPAAAGVGAVLALSELRAGNRRGGRRARSVQNRRQTSLPAKF